MGDFNFSGFSMNSAWNGAASTGTPDKKKETQFYGWHKKQDIPAPNDYPAFAGQPGPFAPIQQNPIQPTAASPYIQKVQMHHALGSVQTGDPYGIDMPTEGRRKSTVKGKGASSSPVSPGNTQWPKSMFGTRPLNRARRSSTNADDLRDESNLPPLASIYDDIPFSGLPSSTPALEPAWTPTQVRVTNYSEDRFPELITALRYYGPILENYSGLPDPENKFIDPEIIPRERLDAATLKMVQPCTGSVGGPGPWVRITFRDREAAERAVASAENGELEVGARVIRISFWDQAVGGAVLPFATSTTAPPQPMDTEPTPAPRKPASPVLTRNATPARSFGGGVEDAGAEQAVATGGYSELMPGAKLVVPKPVEFAKKEGWLASWTSAATAVPKAVAPGASKTWLQRLGSIYSYIMDDLVGFKYL